jgi:hypothetical protein
LAAIKDIQNDEAYEQAVKLLKRENGDSLLLFHVNNSSALPEGPKALEEDWERAGSGAALVLTNQWLL